MGNNNEPPILQTGKTCWRIGQAGRVAVLIDGENYFGAVRAAMLAARRSIVIIGWDVDSRTQLITAEAAPDDAPPTLAAFLTHVTELRPEIDIRILLWDCSILYAADREPLPTLNLGWGTPRQVTVALDDYLPIGAAHHQKIVLVDDAIAFCGGIDLTIRRWDTRRHQLDDPRRVDPAGEACEPFHDMHMLVDGEAAVAVADVARDRWLRATGKDLPRVRTAHDPWPAHVEPLLRDIPVGIARTLPAFDDRAEVCEIQSLLLAAVARAERFIYIENQYLTARCLSDALVARLAAVPDLELVLVSPKEPHGWLEAESMGAGRILFMRQFAESGAGDRVRLVYPETRDGDRTDAVMVHAKLMIVDDRLLTLGSANFNNRSMGFDTECNLALEARTDDERAAIARLRNELIAEHVGADAETVAAALARSDSVMHALDALPGDGHRSLQPVDDGSRFDAEFYASIRPVADPERPLDLDQVVGDMYGAKQGRGSLSRLLVPFAVVLVPVGLLALWTLTPLSDYASPAAMSPLFDEIRGSYWAPLAVVAIYVAASAILFPLTVLVAITAITFGPWLAPAYAMAGAMAAAMLAYMIGRRLGRPMLRRAMGPRLTRIDRSIAGHGVLAVMALRLLPIAPFTIVNLAAGASRIGMFEFVAGSLLGLAPGIAMLTFVGDRLRHVWESPSPANLALLALALALWTAVAWAIHRRLSGRPSATAKMAQAAGTG